MESAHFNYHYVRDLLKTKKSFQSFSTKVIDHYIAPQIQIIGKMLK